MIEKSLWDFAAAGMHFLSKSNFLPPQKLAVRSFFCLSVGAFFQHLWHSPIALFCCSCRWVSQFIQRSECATDSHAVPFPSLGVNETLSAAMRYPHRNTQKPGHVGHAAFQPFLLRLAGGHPPPVITGGTQSALKNLVSFSRRCARRRGVIYRHSVFVPVIIAVSGRMNERDGKSFYSFPPRGVIDSACVTRGRKTLFLTISRPAEWLLVNSKCNPPAHKKDCGMVEWFTFQKFLIYSFPRGAGNVRRRIDKEKIRC